MGCFYPFWRLIYLGLRWIYAINRKVLSVLVVTLNAN